MHLSAIDHLKNYDASALNFDQFDGAHMQTYTAPCEDDYDEITEDALFVKERDYFYGLTQESTEVAFEESINNADIPLSMSAGILTRDKLKQP